jgi:hypothetical protein
MTQMYWKTMEIIYACFQCNICTETKFESLYFQDTIPNLVEMCLIDLEVKYADERTCNPSPVTSTDALSDDRSL